MLLYRQRLGRWRDRLLIVAFLLALTAPLAGFFLGLGARVRTERRQLADFPEVGLKRRFLKAFPGAFDAYFNDHLGFRGVLIEGNNTLKTRGLKVSTSPWVLIGEDGWLYYRTLPPAEMPGPFTQQELEEWQRVLEHRQQWLAQRGCRYVLFIPPNKETIYPEHLPDFAQPYGSVPRLDQLIAHLRNHSSVPILDVRAELRLASRHEQTYFQNDAHWNERGAFVAYQQLGRLLGEWFPAIQPLPRSAFRDTCSVRRGGDLAELIGQDQRIEDSLNLEPLAPRRARSGDNVMVPPRAEFALAKPFAAQTDDARLPRAVMFHDSFALALQPFLSEHFRRIAYYWYDDFLADVVESEHPDVVIQEILERKLNYLKPNDVAPISE